MGYGVVCEYIGYGIGLMMYEKFDVLYYGEVGYGICLKVGMIIIIELMVNIGDWCFGEIVDDGWIVCILDGSFSC